MSNRYTGAVYLQSLAMSSKNEEIVSSIRDAVSAHRLLPGTQLREVSLGRLYGVSRTVVRQALQTLAREGLVDLTPGRIASVAKPTPKEARDAFDLRWVIERHVLETLAQSPVKKAMAALRAHIRREQAALKAGDYDEARRLGAGFHVLMAEQAGNDLLTDTLKQLVGRIALILLLYRHDYDSHVECLQDEHGQLVDLIERGAAEQALELLRKHLHTVEVSLGSDTPGDEDDDPQLRQALLGR